MGVAPSINRNDLTCDVGRIKQQKTHRASDIRRRSDPAEQGKLPEEELLPVTLIERASVAPPIGTD